MPNVREDNAFAVLGMPLKYAIDRGVLHRQYLSRAAGAHPDGVMADDVDESGYETIAVLNRARAVLEDPEKRAVELLNVLCARASVVLSSAERRTLPPGFLQEMLEVREQMNADLGTGDAAMSARWSQWAGEKRAEHERAVGELFAGLSDDRPDPTTLRRISVELNAWRYVERMIEQMHEPPGV